MGVYSGIYDSVALLKRTKMALALENIDVWIGTALGTLKGRVSIRFDTAFAEF